MRKKLCIVCGIMSADSSGHMKLYKVNRVTESDILKLPGNSDKLHLYLNKLASVHLTTLTETSILSLL